MPERALDILQVSTADVLGGAERIAFELFRTYRKRGYRSHLVVGRKRSTDPDVHLMTHDRDAGPWRGFWWGLHAKLQPRFTRTPGARVLAKLFQSAAEPGGWADRHRGIEDFHFPGTWRLLDLSPTRPDILHCHNLHGGFFDLRALPILAGEVPTMLTLHDAWLLSGHCAHAMGCDRWITGCGNCPDLSIYPAIRRDATAHNHQRKADIFRRSRFYVATPCRWLMEQVRRSILAPAIIDARVIPNGIDLSIFRSGTKSAARAALGLPQEADILLFAAYGVKRNTFKDYDTLHEAAARLGRSRIARRSADMAMSPPLILIALGESGQPQQLPGAEIRFINHVSDPHIVAEYHRAADIYVHAARADTFPTAILEALACGTPVVATAIGGIPEQVVPLGKVDPAAHVNATGMLTSPGDAANMASAIDLLLNRPEMRLQLGENAARRASLHHGLDKQATAYLDWYAEILSEQTAHHSDRARTPPAFTHA